MARETELYKDKIEVSLDGRQIFYLFFGGAVIVGMVFVLGVMVGRRVEARGHVERAQVAATVDPLAALDRLEGGSALSFQGALRGEAGAASAVEKTIAEMAKGKGEEKEKEKEKEKKAEEKKASGVKPQAPGPEEKKTEEKKAEVKGEEKRAEEKKGEEKKGEEKRGEEKRAEEKRAEEKKGEEKKDAKVEDKKDKKPEEKKPRFTLQLSSFQDKSEAQAFLDSLKSNGFSPYITEGAVDGKTFYRVRLGSYRSLEAANDAKADFEKSSKKSAQVMKL